MKYQVTDIQRFCMHDGFGIRTTVFLKGCPLSCFWCHNPETARHQPELLYHEAKCVHCQSCAQCQKGVHSFTPLHMMQREDCQNCGACAELCPTGALTMTGKEMTAEEILSVVRRDKAFYGEQGGMTLSGGEPMLHPEVSIGLLQMAQAEGINTAVETSGFFAPGYVAPLCKAVDCLLWDIKDTDPVRHLANTGVDNKQILENLFLADSFGMPIILRCVLLRGVNLNKAHLGKVKEIYQSLKNAVRVDLLPCHSLGNSKKQALGEAVRDLSIYEPSQEEMALARAFFEE